MPYSTKEKRREYEERNKERISFLHAKGAKLHRQKHPEVYIQAKLRQCERMEQLKYEVITHYGNGKCGCIKCGEARLACLSIDHINAIGQPRHIAVPNRHGKALYYWLRKNNYPQGYQTLCMNCQWVKRYENWEMRGKV